MHARSVETRGDNSGLARHSFRVFLLIPISAQFEGKLNLCRTTYIKTQM